MKFYIFCIIAVCIFAFLCWWDQPPEADGVRIQRQIDQAVERYKTRMREEKFCAISALYAP